MFKALVSFSGKISMAKGEVRDIEDKETVKDLTAAGYIARVKDDIKDKEPTKISNKK